METTKNIQLQPKKNKLRMPYERTGAQVVILGVVIFCLLFSFMPLFLTIVNSIKTEEQVKVNAFSFPQFATFLSAAKGNFSTAWDAIGPYYFSTILVALCGAVGQTLISAVLQ